MSKSSTFGIGLVGLGTVGGGVARHFGAAAEVISERTGIELHLARAADLDASRAAACGIAPEIFVADAEAVVADPGVDIVVELIGGTGAAARVLASSLEAGKPVVTANKALLAERGDDLFAAAARSAADIHFEASVCGGIPLIKALREGLVANRTWDVAGILNGTCNHILTEMEATGRSFDSVLREAQERGYAEADPALDIDGIDAAHKATILASLTAGFWYGFENVTASGIRDITLDDIRCAARLGYRIKLLARVACRDGKTDAGVRPTLVPLSHPLAAVGGVYNAVLIRSEIAGDTMHYGRGAGADATASAVLADIAEAAMNRACGIARRMPPPSARRAPERIRPVAEVVSRHYLRMTVEDRAGVLAQVSGILGRLGISIASVWQQPSSAPGLAPLILLTHQARYGDIAAALGEIDRLDCIRPPTALLCLEDFA